VRSKGNAQSTMFEVGYLVIRRHGCHFAVVYTLGVSGVTWDGVTDKRVAIRSPCCTVGLYGAGIYGSW
jgi:hypothetical protein